LELRKEAAKTSTAKIKKMLEMRAADGRMRGNLQYHGAGTGRWAARGAQLQNLPRPKIKDVPAAIDTIMSTGNAELISILHGPPLSIVSDCIRGMIAAPAGFDIMAADFSAIEARVVAWLAGQNNIVQLFASGGDVYSAQASVIYNRKINRKLPEHETEGQVGKVSILSLGYQGGANAFAKMAGNYGIVMDPIYEPVWASATDANREKAISGYRQRGMTSKLSERAWIAAELIKLAWRDANPMIVQYWYDLENAAINAVENPGKQFKVGHITYAVSGSFLWCRLPSGRALCYPYPRIKQVEVPWGEKKAVVYKCVDGYTRKWGDKSFYGGLGCENITQAVARDLMAEAMLRVDAAGYKPIITIHDEVVCEVPKGFGSMDEFKALMVEVPNWAAGCPVAADGWMGKRYRK
jgi:DNA polymerase